MQRSAQLTYPPLDTLKPIAGDVWIVDGPIITFGPRWLKMPFPTRMTVVRLSERRLFIHSPTRLTPGLIGEIEARGNPHWIVAPNRIHYWWVPDWRSAFPDANVYLAPRVREQAAERIDFAASTLDRTHGYPWDTEIATLPIVGRYMTEVEFFHRATGTLILTDLIENFEPEKLGLCMRLLTRLGHVQHPDGQMPRDMRLTFSKPELRSAVERMIAWDPQRIILAHGRWFATNGTGELRRAFRWLLV